MNEITLTTEQKQLLVKYKEEAYAALADIENAKEHLKDVIATAAESTGLKKRLVSKFYKTVYASKLEEIVKEAETLQFLAE